VRNVFQFLGIVSTRGIQPTLPTDECKLTQR
jgi:hypothetical protein